MLLALDWQRDTTLERGLTMLQKLAIEPAKGKLGILTPGMGAVSTTFMAGIEAIRRGSSLPIGSITQMGHIRLGKRTDNRQPLIRNFVPLAELNDLVFGGWDPFPDNAHEAASKAGVLPPAVLDELKTSLEAIKPMPAVFDQQYVKKLDGPNVKKGLSKWELAEALVQDMDAFKRDQGCDRLVMIWCGSTEVFMTRSPVHDTLASFEKGLQQDDPQIAPSMIYAYAAIKSGVLLAPFVPPPGSA